MWKLDIDDIVILVACSLTMCRVWRGMFSKNTLWSNFWRLEVTTLIPHVWLLFSCLADLKCQLLKCLIGQSRIDVVYVIYIHSIVAFYFLMVHNRWFCRRHWKVPRKIFFSWEGFTSHLVIIVRNISCKKVHPSVTHMRHSWCLKAL